MEHVTCNKRKINKQGFTLIEALVVISIIAIISVFLIINFRQAEEGGKLQRSAQKIVQGIRKAQNMALSGVEHEEEIEIFAYGVYFEKQSTDLYIIFFDTNGSYRYDGSDAKVDVVALDDGIIISKINPGVKLHIAFVAPDPLTFLNYDLEEETVTNATITLKIEGGSCPEDCKYIKINNKGWISIYDTP